MPWVTESPEKKVREQSGVKNMSLPKLRWLLHGHIYVSVHKAIFLRSMHFIFFGLFFFFFLWSNPHHIEVPWLGVTLALYLPAYVTATAMPDLSHVCDLHHSSWQCWILSPLSKVRDQTCVLMDTSQICFQWAIDRNSDICIFLYENYIPDTACKLKLKQKLENC